MMDTAAQRLRHREVRDKIQNLNEYGVADFKLSEIPEEEMSFVIYEITHETVQRRIKLLMHRESAYRKYLRRKKSGNVS